METLTYHLSNMPLAGAFSYLTCVYILHKLMTPRKAVNIPKAVLVFYNFAQVAINFYVAYMIAMPLGGKVWGIGLKDSPAVRYGVYLHMLCKYLDYFDTLIIILRKKSEQLSFRMHTHLQHRPRPRLARPPAPPTPTWHALQHCPRPRGKPSSTAATPRAMPSSSPLSSGNTLCDSPSLAPLLHPHCVGVGGADVADGPGGWLRRVRLRCVDQLVHPRHHVLLLCARRRNRTAATKSPQPQQRDVGGCAQLSVACVPLNRVFFDHHQQPTFPVLPRAPAAVGGPFSHHRGRN